MAEIKLTSENFMVEVIDSEVPVLVDFYAQWCGPCKMLAPLLEQIAEEMGKSPKAIDNAMQRIKKKIYAYLGIGN